MRLHVWQIAVCVPCQALAATPIDKISLRAILKESLSDSEHFRILTFSNLLLKADTTSRKVVFLKTCDGLLRERIVLE